MAADIVGQPILSPGDLPWYMDPECVQQVRDTITKIRVFYGCLRTDPAARARLGLSMKDVETGLVKASEMEKTMDWSAMRRIRSA